MRQISCLLMLLASLSLPFHPADGQDCVPVVGSALHFDGNDLVTFGRVSPLYQHTIEAWVKLEAGEENGVVFGHLSGPQAACGYGFYLQAGPQLLQYDVNPSGCGNGNPIKIVEPLVGVWTHLAGTFDGNTSRFYVNGALIGELRGVSFDPSDFMAAGAQVFFNGPGSFFRGDIDEMRIWNFARTQSEIEATMSRPLAGTEPGLVGYWNLDEGFGQRAHDLSPTGVIGILGTTEQSEARDPTWIQSGVPLCQKGEPKICRGDFDGDNRVTVDEVIVGLNNVLNGCDAPATFASRYEGKGQESTSSECSPTSDSIIDVATVVATFNQAGPRFTGTLESEGSSKLDIAGSVGPTGQIQAGTAMNTDRSGLLMGTLENGQLALSYLLKSTAGDCTWQGAFVLLEASSIVSPTPTPPSTVVPSSSGTPTHTPASSRTSVPSSTPTATLTLAPPPSATSTQSTLQQGLVAFWPCSGDVRDESGNGNDGILKNGADFGADRFGVAEHACRFDGIDDIVDIGANVKPSFPVTLSTWINVDTLGANRGVFRSDMWDPNAFYHGFHATVGSTGHVGTGVGSGFASASTRRQFSTDDAVISIGVWHHLAIIYNSPNDMRVFVDGVAHPGTYSGNGGSMTYSSASGAIGHRGLDWMDGRIDDTRVYSRALSEEEIQALASDGP